MAKKRYEHTGIKGFFMGLLPSFEKNHLLEGLAAMHKELAIVREMYALESSAYANKMRTDYKALEQLLREHVPGYRGDLIRTVRESLTARLAEQEEFTRYVEEIYGPVLVKDALDYQKLYTLRYIDGALFFANYARKLILLMVGNELDNRDISSPIDRANREMLMEESNMRSFAIMLGALQYSVKDMRKRQEKLRNIQFNPDLHDTVMRDAANDHMVKSNMVPGIGHLVFMLGRIRNLFIVSKMEEAKHEQEKLQVKLLLLQREREGASNPEDIEKLTRQIDYYNNRLNKISAKLDDIVEGAQ